MSGFHSTSNVRLSFLMISLARGIDSNRFGPWLRGWGVRGRMGGVSGLQDFLPSRNNGLGAAVMHGLRRQSGNALVAVFGVLPGGKLTAKIFGHLPRNQSVRENRGDISGF